MPSQSSSRLPPVRPRDDFYRLAHGQLDEGDLSIVMAHVASLPYPDLERLAEGPDMRRDTECHVCQILKDDNYPNEPQDRARYAGYMLVKWHNAAPKAMYERCLVVYLAARLRIAEEYAGWIEGRRA